MSLIADYQSTGRITIRDEQDRSVADMWGPKVTGVPQKETNRYAALFLASEDMLESLKELEVLAKNFVSADSDVLVRARAAISKAEKKIKKQ